MKYQASELEEFMRENDVKFVKFAFCDVFGRQKILSVLPSLLPKAFEQGVAVDVFQIEGFQGMEEGEVFLVPDTSTLSLLPWRPSHGRVARLYCDIRTGTGEEFPLDSRKLLRDAVKYAEQRGVSVRFGAENDFYLFRTDEAGDPTELPFDSAGYMDEAPEDRGEDVRRDICLTLEDMGIEPLSSCHIGGPGQNRIAFEPGSPLECADHEITFRSVVKTMAARNGLWASFSPKPLEDQAGSGFRIAMRPRKDGQSCAEPFLAGLLRHIRELTAFLNPVEESYERLGRAGAPGQVSWSAVSRAALLRKRQEGRLELASPDGMANPYLAFALLLYAGVEGVEKGLTLPQPDTSCQALPASLQEARRLCRESELLHRVLPKELLYAYTGDLREI